MDELLNETNEEINRRIATEVMGWRWHRLPYRWRWHEDHEHIWTNTDGDIIESGAYWSPTKNAEHAARLRRHLCESGLFSKIEITWQNILPGKEMSATLWAVGDDAIAWIKGEVEAYQSDDPNGFRCLCLAALKAYKALAKEKESDES